jgi:hypothetical protein
LAAIGTALATEFPPTPEGLAVAIVAAKASDAHAKVSLIRLFPVIAVLLLISLRMP